MTLLTHDRSPKEMVVQLREYFKNLSRVKTVGRILGFDPLFGRFLLEECKLDIQKLKQAGELIEEVVSKLPPLGDVATVQYCQEFLAKVKAEYEQAQELKAKRANRNPLIDPED